MSVIEPTPFTLQTVAAVADELRRARGRAELAEAEGELDEVLEELDNLGDALSRARVP